MPNEVAVKSISLFISLLDSLNDWVSVEQEKKREGREQESRKQLAESDSVIELNKTLMTIHLILKGKNIKSFIAKIYVWK